MIYMDNAATSMRKPKEVTSAVTRAMTSIGNAGRGVNDASLEAAREIYETRSLLARLFGVKDPKQIAFTSNSTMSLNMAIKGLLVPGDHVITTIQEHNSVLRPLYELEALGVSLSIVGADEKGKTTVDDIKKAIRHNTKYIITTHASNLTGNALPVAEIGDLARENGLIYIVDASQSAGVLPLDVEAMKIDVLCFTGHKSLYGPQGTGGIYVSEQLKMRPLVVGGTGVQTFRHEQPLEMPTHLEAGTLNGHGIAGLKAGVTFVLERGVEAIRERELALAQIFRKGIADLPGIQLYGDFEEELRCPIVSFNVGDYDSGEVGDELLQEYGIITRTGGHCAPLLHQHFGTESQGMIRFSFSHFNTEEEVEKAITAIKIITTE
ncbi:cysteine desulfurase family protein [Lachnospiraceae bacterium PF1-21]